MNAVISRQKTRGSKRFQSVRARNGEALSYDQIRSVAPSAFADHAWEEVSESYGFLPTVAVIDELRRNELVPVYASQSLVRVEGKQPFAKHLLRFRRQADLYVEHRAQEIILVNSHDRSTSYIFMAGVLELACENGLIVCSDAIESFKARHSKRVVEDALARSLDVVKAFPQVQAQIEDFRAIELSPRIQQAFAQAAISTRFDVETTAVEVDRVLQPLHREHADPSLWSTFQTVQSHLVEQGVATRNRESGRRNRSRPINAIQNNVKLNQALWQLAEVVRNEVRAAQQPAAA